MDEYADKKKGTLSLDDWTDYTPKNIPMQQNGAVLYTPETNATIRGTTFHTTLHTTTHNRRALTHRRRL